MPIPARSGRTVILANGYIDLGTWNCLTPFIGAGVGVAFNSLEDFTDIGIGTSGSGVGSNPTETHLAWALHAGVSYAVTQNFSVELAYRYLNYGSITDTINCTGGCHPDSYKFHNLSSNDFMLGFRWRFPVETGFMAPPRRPRRSAPAADRPQGSQEMTTARATAPFSFWLLPPLPRITSVRFRRDERDRFQRCSRRSARSGPAA